MTIVVFVVATGEGGGPINAHRLVIQPIHDLMKSQGYDCRWGRWIDPWGVVEGLDMNTVSCYVTGDTGIRLPEKTAKAFFHPHGLHPMERGYAHEFWYGYLAPGEFWVKSNVNHPKMPVCGWAKMDVLFKGSVREEAIVKHGLGGLPNSKTVLYAPSGNWDWASSFDASIMHIIKLFETLPYNLIVKTGDYDQSFMKWSEFSQYFTGAPPHMKRISSSEDLTPLYSLADVVITDGSSVAWEFIALDKPVIQLNNMLDPMSALVPELGCCQTCNPVSGYFKGDDRFRQHDICKTCGGVIKCSLQDLKDTVVKAIENPNEYADERRKWAKLVNHPFDGHSTERCVDAIKRIAGI